MSKAAKLIERMRANPRDWRMESLEAVARRYGNAESELAITVPFRRPIKPIYIMQFLALVDDIGEENEESL